MHVHRNFRVFLGPAFNGLQEFSQLLLGLFNTANLQLIVTVTYDSINLVV